MCIDGNWKTTKSIWFACFFAVQCSGFFPSTPTAHSTKLIGKFRLNLILLLSFSIFNILIYDDCVCVRIAYYEYTNEWVASTFCNVLIRNFQLKFMIEKCSNNMLLQPYSIGCLLFNFFFQVGNSSSVQLFEFKIYWAIDTLYAQYFLRVRTLILEYFIFSYFWSGA